MALFPCYLILCDLAAVTCYPSFVIQIGDCLLTLPHQLEPFTASQDNPALNHALQQGVLPFPVDRSEVVRGEEEGEPHPSDDWLGAVARGVMVTYAQQILNIPATLPPAAAQQLATDIGVCGGGVGTGVVEG